MKVAEIAKPEPVAAPAPKLVEAPKPEPLPPPPPVEEVKSAPEPKAPPSEFWPAFLAAIKIERPLIIGLVQPAFFAGINAGVAVIAFPPEREFDQSMLTTHVKFMEEVATRILGSPTRVKLELREGIVAAPVVVDNRDPMEIFKDDPKIRKVLELFQGTLQPG